MGSMNAKMLVLAGGAGLAMMAAAQNQVVAAKPEEVKPVKVGAMAPNADIVNLMGQKTTVHEALAGKKTIMIFYRGGWCPYCNRHLADIAKIEGDLKAMGYQIIALSMDLPAELKKTTEKEKLAYQLYSDAKAHAAKAFGLAFKVDDELVKTYKEKYGIDMEAASGETHHILPAPALYIIDQNKKIQYEHFNPDYRARLKADEVLEAAKKIAAN